MAGEYALKADMVSRFGEKELIELTDREGVGVLDDAVLTTALTEAQGEVNSYIAAVYDLPLPSVPAIVVTATCNIARFRLYNNAATDEVKIRYDDTIRWLRDVARGPATLGFTPETEPTNSVVVVSSREQVFSDTLFSTMGPTWP